MRREIHQIHICVLVGLLYVCMYIYIVGVVKQKKVRGIKDLVEKEKKKKEKLEENYV